jgi:predicted metal-dependent enzyme (double-stranded beta helix superfamily)
MAQPARLVELVDRAVGESADVETLVDTLRTSLCALIRDGSFQLPERVADTHGEHYARRLLHRDERLGYSIIAMTWGGRQGTALHDHAGLWCVESVWKGSIEVLQFEVVERRDELYRFEKCGTMLAGTGSAGCLIPPHEYHVIRNPDPDPAVSVHIYGGDMDFCNVFESRGDGWYQRRRKPLTLDE